MSYSHPAAEYIRILKQQHKRELFIARIEFFLLGAVMTLPMFIGLLNNAPL